MTRLLGVRAGDGGELTMDSQESIRVAGKLIENLEAQTQHNRNLVAAAAVAAHRDNLNQLAGAPSQSTHFLYFPTGAWLSNTYARACLRCSSGWKD